jgi:hypothetical protein
MNRILVLLISLLILTGCSSLKVTSDYDPNVSLAGLEDYAVFPFENNSTDSLKNDRIIEAVTHNLTAKGYTLSDKSSADFYVRFQTMIRENVPGKTGFSIGLGTFSGNIGGSVGTSRYRTYDEETLIIDMLNPSDEKLLWRGVATDTAEQPDSPEERQVYTDKVVDALLASFPKRALP